MSIQKKSLISSMKTTKKAIVASAPASGSTAPAVVKAVKKAGVIHANKRNPVMMRPAKIL
jgi:hypothetical protein